MRPAQSTVAVQGFGNVGSIAAQLLAEQGARIVAVSDVSGGYYNPNGLDVTAMMEYAESHGRSLEGYPNAEPVTNEELLTLDVDVLVPAAKEDQITARNADKIKAKIIAEGANGPTTPKADDILRSNGALVIPDILANAGGVTVSYFEWVKNLSHMRFGRMQRREQEARNELIFRELEALSESLGNAWALSESFRDEFRAGANEIDLVRSGLDDTMRKAFQEMRTVLQQKDGVSDFRTAAYLVAIEKIAESYRVRGH